MFEGRRSVKRTIINSSGTFPAVYVPQTLEGCGLGRLPRGMRVVRGLLDCFGRAGGRRRSRCHVLGCGGRSKGVEFTFTEPGGEL